MQAEFKPFKVGRIKCFLHINPYTREILSSDLSILQGSINIEKLSKLFAAIITAKSFDNYYNNHYCSSLIIINIMNSNDMNNKEWIMIIIFIVIHSSLFINYSLTIVCKFKNSKCVSHMATQWNVFYKNDSTFIRLYPELSTCTGNRQSQQLLCSIVCSVTTSQ